MKKKKYFDHAYNITLAKKLINKPEFEIKYRILGEQPLTDDIEWGAFYKTLNKIRKIQSNIESSDSSDSDQSNRTNVSNRTSISSRTNQSSRPERPKQAAEVVEHREQGGHIWFKIHLNESKTSTWIELDEAMAYTSEIESYMNKRSHQMQLRRVCREGINALVDKNEKL